MRPWNKGLTLEDPRFARSRERTSDTLCRRHYPVCRETVELYAAGLKQREIAVRLGVSVSAVKRRIRRYWELVDRFEEATSQ